LSSLDLGIIGCGNMGEAILKGTIGSCFLGKKQVIFYEKNYSRRKYIQDIYKIAAADNIEELTENCGHILLAVKPQDLKPVLEEIKINFNYKKNSVISIVAGIPTYYIEKMLGSNASVVRIMPNAPALYARGMAAVSSGNFVKDRDLLFARKLIKSVGDYVVLNEKYQNVATALSGSGPAYFFLFCKYLVEEGIKNGLDPEISKKLVIETMIGAGITAVKSGIELDNLIKKVASPGGTTEMALKEFEKGGIDKIIKKAVESAIKRAYELQEFLD
jgi:pyrroline-5-carboxylate reductase